MRFLVIGLGNFGLALVRELTDMGHEVVAADPYERNIDNVKEIVAAAFILDSTDESAISALPLKEMDRTIVTISENLAASLRTVANLKKKKVKNIFARANDEIHKSILEAIGDVTVIMPEVEMAKAYAKKFSEEEE